MSSDIDIARMATMQPIQNMATKMGIDLDDLELYGKYKAKIPLKYSQMPSRGKLILVSAISPTPAGEGKTTVSIGLSQALCRLGHQST
ncbi:MAG: formate--tetrahydrofolate ligase, partial [Mucinivorans sp.]